METKTAPHNAGSRDVSRFARLLPIGAGFAKRNDDPHCPPQAKFFGGLEGVLYKKHKAPRGVAPAAGGKFLGIWGALYTKITLLGCIQERVSGAKQPQNPQKFPPPAGQIPKSYRVLKKKNVSKRIDRSRTCRNHFNCASDMF